MRFSVLVCSRGVIISFRKVPHSTVTMGPPATQSLCLRHSRRRLSISGRLASSSCFFARSLILSRSFADINIANSLRKNFSDILCVLRVPIEFGTLRRLLFYLILCRSCREGFVSSLGLSSDYQQLLNSVSLGGVSLHNKNKAAI